jgi:predicted dehydrogenase
VSARVALAGCGVIAPAYAKTFNELGWVDLVACADVLSERARELAAAHDIPRALTFDELLAADDVDAVVNLTPPLAHADVTGATLESGKAAFSEKPLGVDFAEGVALVTTANQRGLRLGCAPDTWLGPGLQTCRAAIDAGLIGEPVAATGFMLGRGPEWWHPNPDIFYKRGAGPLLDIGPYYLSALVQLLGPATAVTASARITRAKRPILSEPRRGELMTVEVPTHVSASIDFAAGPIATLVTSFDVLAARPRNIEVYGTEGTLAVPDPNTFGGPVRVRGATDVEWRELPLRTTSLPERRGIGAADMLWAASSEPRRAHRCSGELALHVLELMTGAITAAETGTRVAMTTTCEPAPLLPEGLALHEYD